MNINNWCRVGSLNSHYMCMRFGYAARKARTRQKGK